MAHKKLKRSESKHGRKLQPETLEYAKYVILFTTFPELTFHLKKSLNGIGFVGRWSLYLNDLNP